MKRIDTIPYEEFQKRDRMVTDFTINGECSNCGGCCTNFLPMTPDEYNIIKSFIRKHGIKDAYQPSYILKDQQINLVCPFRNEDTCRCNIYEVRPKVCRLFICNLKESEILKYSIEISKSGIKGDLIQARQTFYEEQNR